MAMATSNGGSGGTIAPGIHSLDHFALTVPDLAEARRFYLEFGLDVRDEGGGLSLYTFGSEHLWGRLVKAAAKRLHYLSFAAYGNDLEYFSDRLEATGIGQIAAPADALDKGGLWFRDINGVSLQIRCGNKKTLDEKAPSAPPANVTRTRNAPLRGVDPRVLPTRLSHILIFVPDVPLAVRFYADALGMRLSDSSADIIAFMHAVHGCDHHLVAFAKSETAGFHHSSWDVPSVEAVGRGAMQMRLAGYERGWGVGRHVLGSNYFHYVRDPWGSYAEYSHDMDYIPANCPWNPTSPPPDNSLYLWGPDTPEDFIVNFENQN